MSETATQSNDTVKGKVVRGVPTAPTVAAIIAMHGDLNGGDVVSYADLEKVVMQDRRSTRFKTVITAWKRELWRQNGVVVEAVPCAGYEVLDPKKRVNYAGRTVNHGVHRIRWGASVAMNTDRGKLDDRERAVVDRISTAYASIKLHELTKPKQIELA